MWQSLAVLAGTSVNQDGRSSSLTAPNGPSQQEVMHAALRSGEVVAWEVTHLQMHGTGECFLLSACCITAHVSLLRCNKHASPACLLS
jgi:3-oxoacyl-(acyl-carrier-protein) synthase